jgi:hypothetical protein
MDAPSYPFAQNTSIALANALCRSKLRGLPRTAIVRLDSVTIIK